MRSHPLRLKQQSEVLQAILASLFVVAPDGCRHKGSLAVLKLQDSLLYRVVHDKSLHHHFLLLADAMNPVDGLLLNSRIPPWWSGG
jgi:hypothetical protein